jgi:hypothetical protein
MNEMPNPTGNLTHDKNVLAAELAYQLAGPFTTQAMARTADINRLTAIVQSGQANGISVINQQTALNSLMKSGNA